MSTESTRSASFAISFIALLVVLAVAAIYSAAWGHDHGPGSWMNRLQLTDPQNKEWCCNEHDCRPERVSAVPGGYSTEGGDVVPQSRVIWRSPDGQWWRCRYIGGVKNGQTRCLIAPPPGS